MTKKAQRRCSKCGKGFTYTRGHSESETVCFFCLHGIPVGVKKRPRRSKKREAK